MAGFVVWRGRGRPSLSLDGTPSPNAAAVPAACVGGARSDDHRAEGRAGAAQLPRSLSPSDAFRRATEALKSGERKKALTSLQYAADHGHGVALWQLGRMYAEGDGVVRDDRRAFEYFRKFADSHADDHPATPRVALCRQRLRGARPLLSRRHSELCRWRPVPSGRAGCSITRPPTSAIRTRSISSRRSIVDGNGVGRDAKRAVRWLTLAANKGHYKSQALLGRILFRGEHGLRQPALGPDVADGRERRAGRRE